MRGVEAWGSERPPSLPRYGNPLTVRWSGRRRCAAAHPKRVIAEDLSHSSSEKRYYCFGWVEGGVLTVRFTYRGDVIRRFGAGDGGEGRRVYEKSRGVYGRTTGKAE